MADASKLYLLLGPSRASPPTAGSPGCPAPAAAQGENRLLGQLLEGGQRVGTALTCQAAGRGNLGGGVAWALSTSV